MSLFELTLIGGPWARRLARRRAGFEAMPWGEAAKGASPEEVDAARWVWTQSAFSEHASAAAFAEIATCLIAAGAPIDLVAAAGDFVADEVIHAELSARLAMAFGGAVALEVDPTKLVRPPIAADPLVRAAELVVRTSCVGEALTVPILKTTKARAESPLVRAVVTRIARDESAHAQLGPWFLDWAADRLSDADREHLGRVAGGAVRAFAPIFSGSCAGGSDLGVLDCATYDAAFRIALARNVVRPLAARGIVIPPEDLAAVA
ncbi:MAG: ferritin-like domain-containing protein [Minicystis sp.]